MVAMILSIPVHSALSSPEVVGVAVAESAGCAAEGV
jgi:hypothetical protein